MLATLHHHAKNVNKPAFCLTFTDIWETKNDNFNFSVNTRSMGAGNIPLERNLNEKNQIISISKGVILRR